MSEYRTIRVLHVLCTIALWAIGEGAFVVLLLGLWGLLDRAPHPGAVAVLTAVAIALVLVGSTVAVMVAMRLWVDKKFKELP